MYGRCRDCRDDYVLVKKYGITQAQKKKMISDQGNKCAICGDEHRLLVVDHCHDTGKVRGMLCTKCNTAIGKLNDDPGMLRKAISYLEK